MNISWDHPLPGRLFVPITPRQNILGSMGLYCTVLSLEGGGGGGWAKRETIKPKNVGPRMSSM